MWTPAHQAVENDDLPLLRDLLDQEGANVNETIGDGMSLLHHAIDAEIDSADQKGAPLHVNMTAFLLARGADPLLADGDGRSALQEAIERGHWLAVELMNAWQTRRPQ
jgi:ankyrin repeat protein